MKPYETTCSFYRIRERTKNEFVSVGSAKISRELKTTEYQEGTIERELSYLYRQTFPVGEPFRLVAWTLVDRYTVMRTDRTPIAVWEVALDNTSVVDGFPRPDAGAFRSQLRH